MGLATSDDIIHEYFRESEDFIASEFEGIVEEVTEEA
jgi:hypothetical protein